MFSISCRILKHSGKGTKVEGAEKACNWMQGIGMTINLVFPFYEHLELLVKHQVW